VQPVVHEGEVAEQRAPEAAARIMGGEPAGSFFAEHRARAFDQAAVAAAAVDGP
jgi:hypothetical protein